MPAEKTENRHCRSGFVPNGSKRLKAGIRASVKEVVDAEYADRMRKASWLGRLWLRQQMRAEIERRAATEIARQMPSRETLW
jgi:hypothetical protein